MATNSKIGTYVGPSHLDEDVSTAVEVLLPIIKVVSTTTASHIVLKIEGLDAPGAEQAVAVYLVGSIAECISADMQIRKALFDEATLERDLSRDVVRVIGDDAKSKDWKATRRYPWMWEAISHLFIHLARTNTGHHPSGQILAKTSVKFDVIDHGLDLIGIYFGTKVGITAGECKAYLDDPGRAVTDASSCLREIDENLRDSDLRAAASQLLPSLSGVHQKAIAGAFWREERTYIPFVCCDDSKDFDWERKRPTLDQMKIPINNKILVPLSITDASKVLDEICTLMNKYVVSGGEPSV